ncbi:MAG: glycosyltransferase family 39 protein [Vicinamibacterales bacterium]
MTTVSDHTSAEPPTPSGPVTSAGSGDGFRWEAALLAAVGLYLLVYALLNQFRWDEFEHVHAAWRVANGRIPYLDFFENHHPLIWYVMAALLPLAGESSGTVLVFRVGFAVLAFATLAVTWRLALRATQSRRVAWLAALFLASTMSFLETSTIIRPDTPMMLCVVLSVLFLVRATGGGRRADAVASGVAAGVAIAFLQKAILLLAALVVLAAVRRFRPGRALSGAVAGWFGVGLGATLVAGAGYLAATGAWRDYFWSNWHFNALMAVDLPRFPSKGFSVLANLPFWCLVLGGAGALLRRRRADDAMTMVAVIGCTILAALALTRGLGLYYLLQMLPLLAVVAAWALHTGAERLAIAPRRRRVVVLFVVLLPVVGHAVSMKATNGSQRAAIDYVLARTAPDEPLHDPGLQFNLFRPNLHYLSPLGTDYRLLEAWFRLAGGARAAGYDVCDVLRAGRPRFTSDNHGQLASCDLAGAYRKTPFEGLYERAVPPDQEARLAASGR